MIETVLLKIKIYNLEENFLRIKAKIKKDLLVTRVSQIKNLIKPRYTLVLMLFKNLY